MEATTWVSDDDTSILDDVGEIALPYDDLAHWIHRVGAYSVVVLSCLIALAWWYYKDEIMRASREAKESQQGSMGQSGQGGVAHRTSGLGGLGGASSGESGVGETEDKDGGGGKKEKDKDK